jgi:hypothetical protein
MDQVNIYDRRGAQDARPVEQQGLDPLLELDKVYEKHLVKQDARQRRWEGTDEFEAAFFNTLDDYLDLQEMAEDPSLYFTVGVTTSKDEFFQLSSVWKNKFELWDKLRPAPRDKEGKYKGDVIRINFVTPLYDIGTTEPTSWDVWVKVSPIIEVDWDHVESFKMPRFGDNSVNLTHGELEDVRRQSGGSRFREDELAGDFRTSSKFLLDDVLFTTVEYELPDFPENVQKWLDDEAWPNHENLKASLKERLSEILAYKMVPGKDNRLKEVKAERREEQAKRLKALWGRFWHWWMNKCGYAKKRGVHKPMTNRQLASIKAVFEQFRAGLNLEVPVIKFWARVHCTKCSVSRNYLLPLTYQPMFEEETDDIASLEENCDYDTILCETCKTKTGMVLWFEDHTILEKRATPDWFDIAQRLKERINALYMIGASIDEIKPLESYLWHIEVTHIKIDADQLLWGEYGDTIDQRFC